MGWKSRLDDGRKFECDCGCSAPKPHSDVRHKGFGKAKADTVLLIGDSKAYDYGKKEDEGDLLDKSIIANIEKINRNPLLTTSGSCSGINHDHDPFIAVIFSTPKVRDRYLKIIKERFGLVESTCGVRSGWLKRHYGFVEEYNIEPPEGRGKKEFWKEVTAVLSKP
jgi:hypothetical protein